MLLVSWNMQGAGSGTGTSNISDALTLLGGGVKTLCLQEAGGAPSDWGLTSATVAGLQIDRGYVDFGTSRTRQTALVVWYDSAANTDASHNRCSLAVLSTDYSGTYGVVKSYRKLRPLLGVELANGDWAYTIHAPSGNHKAAAGVANRLLKTISGSKNYICAGDYNCLPSEMTAKGHTVENASGPTHQGGNTLDFAVYKGVTVNLQDASQLGVTQLVSDHYAQYFDVT